MEESRSYEMLGEILAHLANAPRDVFADGEANEKWNAWADRFAKFAEQLNRERMEVLKAERDWLMAQIQAEMVRCTTDSIGRYTPCMTRR